MKRILAISLLLIVGYANAYQFTKDDIDYFQPPIVSSDVPENKAVKYSLYNNTTRVNMSPMQPVVTSFKGDGKLLASWTPHPAGSRGRPTVVIVHGGHGLVPTDFATAVWARDELGANTLVLDSFWSRGYTENWSTWTRLGANARMLDAIAAGRWLQTQDIDRDKVYLMGGSQGGWTVLRTFTDEPFIKENAQGLYAGGIATYPNCNSRGWRDDPELGPYWGAVIVFTAGKDTATDSSKCPSRVFKKTVKWTHYEDATHAFDVSNRGAHTPSVDGECGNALNTYNRFAICRSDKATSDMYTKIKEFIK